jgi:oligopeptidase A
MQNPLLELSRPIPFDQIRAEHMEPAVRALMAEASAAIDTVAASPGPHTYESTLGALERSSDRAPREREHDARLA